MFELKKYNVFLLVSAILLTVSIVPSNVNASSPYLSCSPEQTRASQRWWIFGNRVIMDFGSSGSANPTISQNPSSITAIEGTTVVTDTSGELMFYSNGQTVWNKNHQAMPNGTGLIAAPSATQTVAAFPSLTRSGIYFVVSNGGAYESGGVGPLRYTEVDMSLNGGLGDVIPEVKNVLLDGGANTATEGMTAVPNSTGTGFWVITATGGDEVGNKNIVAHEFDGDGPTGTIVRSEMSTPNGDTFGTFNVSADMTKMVQLVGFFDDGYGQIRLLDFDAETGVVTEIVTWDTPSSGTYAYSADFSPDGRWVYMTRIFGTGQLYRYDTQTHTTAEGLEENVEALGSIGTNGGQVKRAPNGKMYIANYGAAHLGIINDPNNVSNPDYVAGGVSLPGGTSSQFGLPQVATGCPIPQTAPSNLTASASGYDEIELEWNTPVDVDANTLLGYRIERSLNSSDWDIITTNTNTIDTTYLDTGLVPGTQYYYRVMAVYESVGDSDPSNIATATTSTEAAACTESYVECMENPVTSNDAVLIVDEDCEITDFGVLSESEFDTPDAAGYSYPMGMLDFSLSCSSPGFTTTVTQQFYEPPSGKFILRKFSNDSFQTIANATIEVTTVNGNPVLSISYEVTDGGPLDDDGVANGVIVDPAGPAQSSENPPNNESQSHARNATSSSSSSSSFCANTKPYDIPDLFQIDMSNTQARIYFTPLISNVTNYFVSYGYTPGDERFGVMTNLGSSTGVLSYMVKDLSPNMTYYFRVRPYNGCMPGEWSNEMKVVTVKDTSGAKYYKNFKTRVFSLFPKHILEVTSTDVLGVSTETLRQPLKCEDYTILPGDSLWNIASRYLGTGNKYPSLVSTNNLQTKVLIPGQIIKVGCSE